ncbi:MAG: 4Fe-4S dicluster domain-containing protein [Ruminococcaceae bacterium]|nr:4Fe-4S dicluster domain-containing protein [Oscillospiraceae bacterium]MBO4972348.1 4Fe-4S dicluster domain-containing protein [Clostridia bacterium]MBQ1260105.1 4Fe-4S dicluster domain-containing protein [Clostridia bacterium]
MHSSNKTELKKLVLRISGAHPEKCMKCGKCSAACPAFDEMEIHPHKFAQMVLDERVEELATSKGIYKCMSCFACLERCPRDVKPAKIAEAARAVYLRQQGASYMKQDEIPSKLDDEIPGQALMSAMRKYNK